MRDSSRRAEPLAPGASGDADDDGVFMPASFAAPSGEDVDESTPLLPPLLTCFFSREPHDAVVAPTAATVDEATIDAAAHATPMLPNRGKPSNRVSSTRRAGA